MAGKSVISAVLFGVEVPSRPGRTIKFGQTSDDVDSTSSISAQIIRFLRYVEAPCTKDEISFEIDKDSESTKKSLDALLLMEVVRCVDSKPPQRAYELIKYIT